MPLISSIKPTLDKGFTLIETMIYLALFVVIIGGGLAATYQIITASTEAIEQALVYEEANFIMGKISWALLSGSDEICQPTSGNTSSNLHLYSDSGCSADPILFTSSAPNLTIKVGSSGSTVNLNSDSLRIENVEFEHIAATGGEPAALKTSFTVTDKLTGKTEDIETIKYLRNE